MDAPSPAEIEHLVGLYYQRAFADAIEQGTALTKRAPEHPLIHNVLGAAHASLGHFDRAIGCYRQALIIDPGAAAIHNNIGAALRAMGDIEGAVGSYRNALLLAPDYADAHNNLGNALRLLGRPEDAVASFTLAVQIDPGHADALYNLGNMAMEAGGIGEAIAIYGRALAARPDFAAARAHRLHLLGQVCDWDAIAADAAHIPQLGIAGGSLPPFTLLALDDSPERHRIRAERYAANVFGQPQRASFTPSAERPERLRIGYFSADFEDHATLRLMAGLFERHDRSRFEIHAYSYGADRDDVLRHRLLAAVDGFHDIRALSDDAAAAQARADGIDIAVDLKGLSHQARLGIFARGAAPVQIGYLGYPGTVGAPFIDYMIADHVVIPDEERAHYSEHILFLRHSYQVNDDRRSIADVAMTRADMGLPDRGFVFCSFNASYKIEPRLFDIWMRLLAATKGSILWLLGGNTLTADNLRREAAKRGIAPDRLIFAEPLPQAEYLARLRLADLFLDSFACNAHTTASDALWAGLPLLTLPGRGFAARVAASLLGAVDLPELIATSPEDYEARALDLARDPARLAAIRAKLATNRRSRPLFRTDLTTAQIERAYEAAHARWRDGLPPIDIDVAHIAPLRRPASLTGDKR